MELKEIKILLNRFFEGETTEQEENLLAEFFRNEDVPSELKAYQEFFFTTNQLSKTEYDGFEDDIMNHILENEHQEKNKFRWMWQMVSSVAAILLIALLVVNYQNQVKDTYDDPDIAYAEATNALRYMAGKYQKGMAELQPIAKLDKATDPLKSGLSLVNKGFEEMSELKKVNKKIKK